LATDKFCLQEEFKKQNKEPVINGGKKIKDLIAGATITVGAGRSGKTQQVIKPSILHLLQSKNKSSMVICDLKGDIFKMTSNLAKDNGYQVLRFNTTNAKFSHS
jgi:type IV secretory pathway TraG/TraD family ATPase VirD4